MGLTHAARAPRPWTLAGLCFLLSCSLSSAPADAQVGIETTRLTDFQTRRGAVSDAVRSPDGQWVVYRASQEAVGRTELYAVPAAGGVAIKLNQPLVEGGNVSAFEISLDSSTVAFRADAETAAKHELYRVPIDGGNVTRVNGPMVPGGDVDRFGFTDTTTHVVYTATQRHFQIEELFSHALAGGTVSMLSPQLGVGGEIVDFEVSPDSSRVVFIAADPGGGDLYSAPIGGGGATQLGDPPSLPDTIRQFEVLADNTTVLFTRASNSIESELLRTAITGGAVTPVGPPGMTVIRQFGVTPDDTRAVVIADFEDATDELFSLDLATDGFTLLTGTSTFIREFFIAPDNTHVAFCGDGPSAVDPFDGLAIVPLAGGSVTELDPTVFRPAEVEFSPDGSRLLYRKEFNGLHRLFSTPADGSTAPVELVPPVVEDGVVQADFDTTGDNILFRSDHGTSGAFEVYTVPWNGELITRLSDSLVEGGWVRRAFLDGDTLLYWADQDEVGVVELFSVAAAGGAVTKLNPPFLGTAGRTRHAELTPDGQTAIFIANQVTFGQDELWGYDLTGNGPAVRLSEAPFAESQVEGFPFFRIDPSSQRVVFRASREDPDVYGLYSAPVEGGPVVQLNDPADGSVFGYEMTADGQWMVYVADGPSTDPRVLRTGVAGSDVRLLFEIGSNPRYKLSPDSQSVVYIDNDQLFSIPIDAGSPVLLSTPDQTVDDDRREFVITPDSSRVIYRAFSASNNREELYSVPILGGEAITLGTDTALCNSNHDNSLTPVVTPDSSRVLFLCGPFNFPTLHSAPVLGGPTVALIDGNDHLNFGVLRVSPDSQYVVVRFFVATSNTKLVGIPVDGGEETVHFAISDFDTVRDVGDFQFSLDSSTLFFLGDDDPVTSENLYSAPTGPGEPTRVNPDGNVTSFAIAPDGSRIFYTAAPLFFDQPRKADLVSMPIEGGPVMAHHPTLPDARFATLRGITDDGLGVLYSADQDQDQTFDLYFARTTQLFLDGFESGDTSRWSSVQP